MHRGGNRQEPLPNRYGAHATDSARWPVVLPSADFSALTGMPDENAATLEFAAILGEAIARAHLSGKQAETTNANTTAVDDRGVCEFLGLTKRGSKSDDNFSTKTTYCQPLFWLI